MMTNDREWHYLVTLAWIRGYIEAAMREHGAKPLAVEDAVAYLRRVAEKANEGLQRQE